MKKTELHPGNHCEAPDFMNQTKCRINVASIWLCTAFLMFTVAVNPVKAQFAGGSGTEEDPYQIASIEQLQKIGESEYWSRHFIQIADIDASDTKNWNDGKGFKPVTLLGSYEGNGYVISNLYINRKEEDNVGLFRTLSGDHSAGRSGRINRIGLENVDIKGRNNVGGLAGSKGIARVTSSYVTGKVTGQNRVGGLFGNSGGGCSDEFPGLDKSPDILSSYAHVEVSGKQMVGGIAGEAMMTSPTGDFYRCGHIHETYASGSVSGDDMVGGWIGLMEDVRNHSANYWNKSQKEDLEAIGYYFWPGAVPDVEGLTTDQMTGQNAFIFMYKLDFENTWQLTEGYPVLAWQDPEDAMDPPQVPIIRIDTTKRDFGVVSTDKFKTLEVPIRNTGNNMLNGEVYLAGPDAGLFTIADGLSTFSLEAGSSQDLAVSFYPEGLESYEGELHVVHDAPNLSDTLIIPLVGQGKEPTDATLDPDNPRELALHQNYPNPFNPVTIIEYALPELADVTLQVYDVMGRLVETLVDELKTHGKHQTIWDASDAASGTYIYRLQAGDVVISRKLMLIK